jgi:hypothetical protein
MKIQNHDVSSNYTRLRKKLTVFLLPPAYGAIGALWSFRDARVEETLLSFADPPILESIQKHFCSAHPADPLARRVQAGFGTGWYAMNVHE